MKAQRFPPSAPGEWTEGFEKLIEGLRVLQLTPEDAKRLSEVLHHGLNGATAPPRIGFTLIIHPYENPFEAPEDTRHVVTNEPPLVSAALLQMAANRLSVFYQTERDQR